MTGLEVSGGGGRRWSKALAGVSSKKRRNGKGEEVISVLHIDKKGESRKDDFMQQLPVHAVIATARTRIVAEG